MTDCNRTINGQSSTLAASVGDVQLEGNVTNSKNYDGLEEAIASLAERVSRLEKQAQLAEPGSSAPPAKAANTEPIPAVAISAGHTKDLEARIGGSWLNRAGGVAILCGVSYFLKYAFDNAWIGPRARVILGLLAGLSLVFASERVRRRSWEEFSYSLKALGFGILYLSIWASSQLYDFVAPGIAFGGMILVTMCAVGMALLLDAQLLASMAALGGFLTPLLLSTPDSSAMALFAYAAFLDLGIIAMLRYRPWDRLATGALAGTLCLLFSWHQRFYSSQQFATTIVAASLFFTLFLLLPLLSNASSNSRSLAPVVVGNAVLSFSFMASLLKDIDHERALALVALAMSVLYFVITYSKTFDRPLASYYSAQAVVLLSLAIPIGLDAQWTTWAWLVEGAALIWVGSNLNRRIPARLGGILLASGIFRLFAIDRFTVAHLVFNDRMLAYAIAVVALALAARALWTSRRKVGTWSIPIVIVSATALAFLCFNLEIQDFWQRQRADAAPLQARQLGVIRDFAYSALWIGFGGVLIGIGFWRRSRLFRWQALALLTVTVFKVFLYDTMSLDRGYRIASFILLGVVLLAISVLYQRKWPGPGRRRDLRCGQEPPPYIVEQQVNFRE